MLGPNGRCVPQSARIAGIGLSAPESAFPPPPLALNGAVL
jgi:hypothetical protein